MVVGGDGDRKGCKMIAKKEHGLDGNGEIWGCSSFGDSQNTGTLPLVLHAAFVGDGLCFVLI